MSGLIPLLDARELVPPLSDAEAEMVAKELAAETGLAVYARSIVARDGRVFFMARRGIEKMMCVMARDPVAEFVGTLRDAAHGSLLVCPLTESNAAALRAVLPYTAPRLTGDSATFGMGDRLGLATPGHVRAVRGSGVMPVLAQQSVREMGRTGRTPRQVIDDVTWGVFEEGFRDGFGADAEHLKTSHDVDATLSAGFRMFTVDPGDFVDDSAVSDDAGTLEMRLGEISWAELETTEADCRRAFLGRRFQVGHDMALRFDEESLLRAVVKYARAVAHVARLYRHIVERADGEAFELEISVDETSSATTPAEHFYVAHELRRLGVRFASLAPRFVGDFEKGVDYKGDLRAFEDSFVQHVQVARYFGGYKISIHSGSDKFSIYPIVARHAGDRVHVKTAGTSYLEALRAVAEVDPRLFREILAFALTRYAEDRATYHVSGDPSRVASPETASDEQLSRALDGDDGRQVLHVTYGSVLNARDERGGYRFRDRLYRALRSNEEVHYRVVARHLGRHLAPFVSKR